MDANHKGSGVERAAGAVLHATIIGLVVTRRAIRSLGNALVKAYLSHSPVERTFTSLPWLIAATRNKRDVAVI